VDFFSIVKAVLIVLVLVAVVGAVAGVASIMGPGQDMAKVAEQDAATFSVSSLLDLVVLDGTGTTSLATVLSALGGAILVVVLAVWLLTWLTRL